MRNKVEYRMIFWKNKITLKKVAAELGVNHQTIRNVLTGKTDFKPLYRFAMEFLILKWNLVTEFND